LALKLRLNNAPVSISVPLFTQIGPSLRFECKSTQLVSLAYEVLNHMETPPEGTTDLEMLLLLSQAFLDKAPEADPPKEWKGTFMFSKLDDVLETLDPRGC
jgi:hypothetical protein